MKQESTNTEKVYVTPATDIYEEDNRFVLLTDLPGVTKQDLNITVENNNLEIVAKTDSKNFDINSKEGAYEYLFKRVFRINKEIDPEKISAHLENGVLTLELTKSEALKPRKIEVLSAT